MVIVPGIDVSLLLRLLGIIYIYSSIQAIIIIGFDDCNIIVLSQKKKEKKIELVSILKATSIVLFFAQIIFYLEICVEKAMLVKPASVWSGPC